MKLHLGEDRLLEHDPAVQAIMRECREAGYVPLFNGRFAVRVYAKDPFGTGLSLQGIVTILPDQDKPYAVLPFASTFEKDLAERVERLKNFFA